MVKEIQFTIGETEYTYREMTDGKILRNSRFRQNGKPSGWKLSKLLWTSIEKIATERGTFVKCTSSS